MLLQFVVAGEHLRADVALVRRDLGMCVGVFDQSRVASKHLATVFAYLLTFWLWFIIHVYPNDMVPKRLLLDEFGEL